METVQVKERPILFSGPMVRALLAGTKTQTRRAIKGIEITDGYNPNTFHYTVKARVGIEDAGRNMELADLNNPLMGIVGHCPYGQPGDRLYVRETWNTDGDEWYYRADFNDGNPRTILESAQMPPEWKPSIHMPKRASRLLLEVLVVRVERTQDISEADALAEGVEYYDNPNDGEDFPHREYRSYLDENRFEYFAADSFRTLWQAINGSESWTANPWVWVVEFKVISPAPAATPTLDKTPTDFTS